MQIVYAGPKDNKEAKGMFFPRLTPVEVTPDIARELCAAKPRVFFYPGEQLPEAVIEDRMKLHQQDAKQWKKHIRDYTIQAAQYTDEKDAAKREGAEAEIAWAEDRLMEAKEAHRQVLATIHEDEDKILALSEMRPQAASPTDVALVTLSKDKKAAEEKVDSLSRQVEELTALVLSLKSVLPQVPVTQNPPASVEGAPAGAGNVDGAAGAEGGGQASTGGESDASSKKKGK